jgi:hypothetical protein
MLYKIFSLTILFISSNIFVDGHRPSEQERGKY